MLNNNLILTWPVNSEACVKHWFKSFQNPDLAPYKDHMHLNCKTHVIPSLGLNFHELETIIYNFLLKLIDYKKLDPCLVKSKSS